MASDVTINNALDFAKSTSNSSAQLTKDFNDFLSLLTTQLQNQDPLSPMDSTEFTNQLVAFSGVEQQINANKKLDSLVSMGVGNTFSSSLSYVGKDVSYLSSEANFDGTNPVKLDYAVKGDAVNTKINILDQDGKLVFSQNVSNASNATEFIWDGKSTDGISQPAGTYKIQVDAFDGQNQPLTSTTVVRGHVGGIETQNGTNFLLIGDRAVSIGNVINVTEPKTTLASNANN